MPSRRILITGLSSPLGGRLAQLLEPEASIEAIVGIDTDNPVHELRRTEFVRVQTDAGLIRRIVDAAAIDTIVDTRLVVDSLTTPLKKAHQINVVGTENILAACAGSDSPVRKLVFKSSAHYYGCEPDDPAFFTEEMRRPHPPRSAIERDIIEAERSVAEFGARGRGTTVTILRIANGIEPGSRTWPVALLGLPVVPSILGFDPRCQFIHGDDIVGVLEHAVREDIHGIYNAAADGVLALSEVAALLGKSLLPVLPPWGTGFTAAQLRRLGLRIPVELLRQLRFGRGLDNRRLKASGYSYRFTTREAVLKLGGLQRLRMLLRSGAEPYRYEREVEEFLRWSPTVQPLRSVAEDREEAQEHALPLSAYDGLSAEEVIEALASLDVPALLALRSYETGHRSRPSVLTAIDRKLARRRSSGAAS